MITGGLKFTNGIDMRVNAQTNSALDNMTQFTVMLWASVTTGAPAAQRSFFGKAVTTNGIFGAYTNTNVNVQIKDSAAVDAVAVAAFSALPPIVVNQPMFWVFQGERTVAANMRVALGSLTIPATYATSYTVQRAGSGTHDDSGNPFVVGNWGAASATQTLPGTVYTCQVVKGLLRLDEIRWLQYHWTPRYSGSVLAWRLSGAGPSRVQDESNMGIHGTASGSPVTVSNVIPRVAV